MIKLGLIEDNQILRENYEEFFTNDPEFKVVFSVEDLHGIQNISHTFQPEIILLDLLLPSGNSLSSLHKLKQYFPSSNIVILSNIIDIATTNTALRNGASGFLLKSSSLSYIKDSLFKIAEGGIPLSPVIVQHLFNFKKENTLSEDYPSLTKRELELIELLKTGIANKTAALSLKISGFTINQHLKNIYTKLNINSKGELIAMSNRFSKNMRPF